MYISEKLQCCVNFANFCRDHGLSPRKVAEAIQACKDVNKKRSYNQISIAREAAAKKIKELGFVEVSFLDGIPKGAPMPSFKDDTGETIRFPPV